MFNVFAWIFVCVLLEMCVCDIWDDADHDRVLGDVILELNKKYKEVFDGSDEATFTFRRTLSNKEYIIHVNRLKAVNGLKRHNLIVKEKSDDNPLIYISNPVETKIPNAYMTLEEFKGMLTDRALRQKKEFKKNHKYTKSSIHVPNKNTLHERKLKQTKPTKHVRQMEMTKTMATIVKMTTNAAVEKDISDTPDKISIPATSLPQIIKILKLRISTTNKSTIQKSTVAKLNNDKLITNIPLTTELLTGKVTSVKASNRESTTASINAKKSFIDVPISKEPTLHTIEKDNNKNSTTDQHNNTISPTTESVIKVQILQEITKNNLTEVINVHDTKKFNTEVTSGKSFLTTKSLDSHETGKTDLPTHNKGDIKTVKEIEHTNIKETVELTKKPVLVHGIEDITSMLITNNSTTAKPTTKRHSRRKPTQESSEENLPKWTKRLTTRLTTKATTRRTTLGRPLVYMDGMANSDGNQST